MTVTPQTQSGPLPTVLQGARHLPTLHSVSGRKFLRGAGLRPGLAPPPTPLFSHWCHHQASPDRGGVGERQGEGKGEGAGARPERLPRLTVSFIWPPSSSRRRVSADSLEVVAIMSP